MRDGRQEQLGGVEEESHLPRRVAVIKEHKELRAQTYIHLENKSESFT